MSSLSVAHWQIEQLSLPSTQNQKGQGGGLGKDYQEDQGKRS